MGSMKNTNTNFFYKDKPLFGLDIGYSSVKVMQIESVKQKHAVLGYGVTDFEPSAIKDGVIVNPEVLAQAIHNLFASGVVGTISTRSVAAAIPAVRTFNRNMTLPKMETKDL